MSEAFNATKESIGGLLSSMRRERIVVPPFQRGYMWKEKHIKPFWQDVIQFQAKRPFKGEPDQYFLGPTVTLSGEKNEGIVWLLDGQQRLATATILFSVIRDLANENGTDAGKTLAHGIQSQLIKKSDTGFSLELGETDAVYFRETIQMDSPTSRKPILRTHYNIKKARNLLIEYVRKHIGVVNTPGALTKLKDLRQTLISDLVMANIPVGSESSAFQIFETLNARGLGLQAPDLLLNYLMRRAPEGDRKDIREYWTEMLNNLKRFDINRFLRHLWVSKYGDLKSKDLFVALKEQIEADKADKELSSKDFARSCADECATYVQILTIDEESISEDTAPALKGLVRELDVQAALPLLLSSKLLLQPKDFDRVVRSVLVFYMQYAVIANLDRDDMADLLYALAKTVRQMITDPLDKTASKNCANHVKDTLASNAPKPEELKIKAADLNFEEDANAKYMLLRLANYIQSPTKEVAMAETNLEHIYPQNPKAEEWGGEAGHAVLNPLLWHLGNLTIYGKRLNRTDQNKEYETFKRKSYSEKTDVIMTKQIAQEYEHWNDYSIQDRAAKLAKKALEIWSFDNASRV
jgi:Protein of unknown function DUF262/Protein of unknown function (DUF1524)